MSKESTEAARCGSCASVYFASQSACPACQSTVRECRRCEAIYLIGESCKCPKSIEPAPKVQEAWLGEYQGFGRFCVKLYTYADGSKRISVWDHQRDALVAEEDIDLPSPQLRLKAVLYPPDKKTDPTVFHPKLG